MSIGVAGQYLFSFNLGSKRDFISEKDLNSFILIEEAGNVLPTFSLSFQTQDEEVIPQLHEGSQFKVSFGRNRDALLDTPLAVTRLQTNHAGSSARTVTAVGLFAAIPYLNASRMFISDELSAVEVMKQIVSRYFSWDSNVERSAGRQRWIQPSQSDKKFVGELWIHADIPGSFLAVGISADGKFRARDLKRVTGEPEWNFTRQSLTERDIGFDGDFLTDVNTGFTNAWGGYGREMTVYSLEEGVEETVSESPTPVVALTQQLAKNSEVEARFSASGIVNDNVTPNYWRAALRNVTSLAAFGSVRITLSFHNRFVPIRVLDKVMFKDENVTSQMRSSSEFNSGVYFVSKVTRSISNRQFVTTVVLCRESLNQVRDAK